jgi:predicted transposase YbfD/YdcC
MRWAAALHKATGGKIVAIDGKTVRRSFDNAKGHGPIHLVSAWCSENHVSLGQLAVDAKTKEITAIPELLELLEIPGAIVTIDAAGYQRAIATKIRKQKADYVLALKKNQNTLYEDVAAHFEQLQNSRRTSRRAMSTKPMRKATGAKSIARPTFCPCRKTFASENCGRTSRASACLSVVAW